MVPADSAPPPRRPVYAPNGAVATSQPLAAAAGLEVLRRGGNAVDAAIATAITLTQVQPGSNDIGGDLFALVWDGDTLHGLNGSGRSPAALTREAVLDRSDPDSRAPSPALGGLQATAETVPARGWLPVTVPGAPAAWRDLHERFGRLPFADLFTDAIGYAERGYPVSPGVAAQWARVAQVAPHGPEHAEWRRVYLPDDRAPRPGERFRNPDAAATLRRIAATGADDFYRGETAAAVADFAARTGGLLTAADLADHRSEWVEPISAGYRGYDVWELPPNGQGIATLLALNILDGLPPAQVTPHRQIEAMKLAFADAHTYVADPAHRDVPVKHLLSEEYARSRRNLIGESAALPVAGDPEKGGTVYLCAADTEGMMVSLIQSNYMGFGSYLMAPGTGFGLQNRGAGFALSAEHPNAVGPGRRPYHTIIPGFLTRAGQPVGPFGVMGGHMQPQGHLQVVLSTVDEGLDPQAALDRPRWYWHTGRQVLVEPGLAGPVVDDLRTRGHEVAVLAEPGAYGYGQIIWRLPDGAGYVAGSEPRADGCALGY